MSKGIIQNMAGIIGNSQLLPLLNRAIKQRYQKNRPFITIVVEDDGIGTVHSNMDHAAQRIELLEQTLASLKAMQN